MIQNIMNYTVLIQKTARQEQQRQENIELAYETFINKINQNEVDQNGKKLQFLNIDLKNKYYGDSNYLVDIDTDELVSRYGISRSDINNRINELMNAKKQPYRCSYVINWYSGKGLKGFLKKIQCKYPYVKSVDFIVQKTSYVDTSSNGIE